MRNMRDMRGVITASTRRSLKEPPNLMCDGNSADLSEITIKRDKGGWVAECDPAKQQTATADSGTVSR